MKKKCTIFCTLIVSVLTANNSYSQIYTQDADGKTTIIAPGSSINFDVSKEALSINWNNWQNLALDKRFFWGVAAKGKNEKGVANLFSEGSFVPTTRVNGFVAFKKIISSGNRGEFESAIKQLRGSLGSKQKEIFQLLDVRAIGIELINNDKTLDETQKSIFTADYKKLFIVIPSSTEDYLKLIDDAIEKIKNGTPIQKMEASIFSKIKSEIEANLKLANTPIGEYGKLYESLKELEKQYQDYRNVTVDRNLLFYINGGVNASKFRLYDTTIAGSLGDRIVKTPNTNEFIDLGVNYDIGARWLIGASIGYEKFSTFDSLTDGEAVLRSTTVVGNQTLIEDKAYTIYTGNFFRYNRANFKFDIMRFGKLGEEARYGWNVLYGRIWLPFGDKKPKGIINLGTAFNFHKKDGKFIGGIYCEAVDVRNSMGADTHLAERLSLGIVATFSFNSIIGHY